MVAPEIIFSLHKIGGPGRRRSDYYALKGRRYNQRYLQGHIYKLYIRQISLRYLYLLNPKGHLLAFFLMSNSGYIPLSVAGCEIFFISASSTR